MDGDHYKLVFGDAGVGTWSQKYNLVWDKLLDLNVFPLEVIRKEVSYYKTKIKRYGLPLDSRKEYTKLDWQFWTATLAENSADFRLFSDACAKWANETVARVPLTDWYETDSGKQCNFQARSVVGGVYIGLMRDPSIWQKYSSRDKASPAGWAKFPSEMPPMRRLLAAADTSPATWKYTTAAPSNTWMLVNFDDAGWNTGKSGFGASVTAGAIVHTRWDTKEIYLRHEFELPEGELHNPHLMIHHEDEVEVYINGVLATRANGFMSTYATMPVSKPARAVLRPGKNVVAVYSRQHSGGQYIDVGLVDAGPAEKP